MAGNVTLSASVRDNLLSLQSTSSLISQTQGRLSTGLRVASPIDDPVSFFQAKSLSDRAADFTAKKEGIDQGVSTVTAALKAVEGVESMVKQLKGLVLSAKSATTQTQINDVITQFNDLRGQVSKLTSDATYQGLNLVNGTGSTLSVSFSNDTASLMTVASKDITAGANGLNINELSTIGTSVAFNFAGAAKGGSLSVGKTIVVTVANSAAMTLTAGSGTISYGTYTVTYDVTTAAGGQWTTGKVLSSGEVVTLTVATVATAGGVIVDAITGATDTETLANDIKGSTKIGVGFTTTLNNLITDLESDLTTIRSVAQGLGTNVSLLNTRLDFTKNYVNTLTAGAGKLTLADLNEEGANLLALQTRQQLGIQALSFAGQSEQGILGLFR